MKSGFLDRFFTAVANRVSSWAGRPMTFISAISIIVIWAVSGPIFGWSDTWQLIVNTATTVVTFLMVFLIQNAQNRESKAIHFKLDELILGVNHARNELIDIERLTVEQLEALSGRYRKEAGRYQHKLIECFPTGQFA